jgi:hypothetical protein
MGKTAHKDIHLARYHGLKEVHGSLRKGLSHKLALEAMSCLVHDGEDIVDTRNCVNSLVGRRLGKPGIEVYVSSRLRGGEDELVWS